MAVSLSARLLGGVPDERAPCRRGDGQMPPGRGLGVADADRARADARLERLVRDLREESDTFTHLWVARTAAAQHTTDRKTIRHPEVGDILLDCDVLVVPGADLRMVSYTAGAGSSEAGKLDLLRVTGNRTTAALP